MYKPYAGIRTKFLCMLKNKFLPQRMPAYAAVGERSWNAYNLTCGSQLDLPGIIIIIINTKSCTNTSRLHNMRFLRYLDKDFFEAVVRTSPSGLRYSIFIAIFIFYYLDFYFLLLYLFFIM